MADTLTLETMFETFTNATCAEDVFGVLAADKSSALRSNYRRFTKACHPDLADDKDKVLAGKVTELLIIWRERAAQKIKNGTYGDYAPEATPKKVMPKYAPVELKVGKKPLILTGLIGEGVFSSVHSAEFDNDHDRSIFVKITRDCRDNDLVEREISTLRKLWKPSSSSNREQFYKQQRTYIPYPVSSFFIQGADKRKHRASILTTVKGECYTLRELRDHYFTAGLPAEAAYWIFRRLLLTLWMAHLRGVVHGGVTPDHILVYPEPHHGIVLLDWTCATEIGKSHIPAINPAYKHYYAPEVTRKAGAAITMDIFSAAMCFIYMIGGDVENYKAPLCHAEIAKIITECIHPDAHRRPQDAERLHNRLGDVLRVITDRKYVPFIVPKGGD